MSKPRQGGSPPEADPPMAEPDSAGVPNIYSASMRHASLSGDVRVRGQLLTPDRFIARRHCPQTLLGILFCVLLRVSAAPMPGVHHYQREKVRGGLFTLDVVGFSGIAMMGSLPA